MTSEALTNDDWPTLAEELLRKGVAVVEQMMQRHEAGEISDKELSLVCGALWDQVSGLAPEKYCRLLEAIIKDVS